MLQTLHLISQGVGSLFIGLIGIMMVDQAEKDARQRPYSGADPKTVIVLGRLTWIFVVGLVLVAIWWKP